MGLFLRETDLRWIFQKDQNAIRNDIRTRKTNMKDCFAQNSKIKVLSKKRANLFRVRSTQMMYGLPSFFGTYMQNNKELFDI